MAGPANFEFVDEGGQPIVPDIIGGYYTESRGVMPSMFHLRAIPQPGVTLPAAVGTVKLRYVEGLAPGQDLVIEWPNCAMPDHTLRVKKFRDGDRLSLLIFDGRWLWRYPKVSGRYNVRGCDGRIVESTKKTLQQLIELLLKAMGADDPAPTLTNIPPAHPYVHWQQNNASRELESLLELYGLILSPPHKHSGGVDEPLEISPLGTGTALPTSAPSGVPRVEAYPVDHAVLPEKVKLVCGPSVWQVKLETEWVGRDSDGRILRPADLSYAPASWASESYESFPGVPPQHRHHAFETLYRWYRIKAKAPAGVTEPVDEVRQFELLEHSAEVALDIDDNPICLGPAVEGRYWPLCDDKTNTADDVRYSGEFRIRPGKYLVEFEYPVVAWDNNDILAPANPLYLITAFHLRKKDDDEDGNGYIRYEKEQSVSQATDAAGPRVVHVPWLQVVTVEDPIAGMAGSNQTEVFAEADAILQATVATYANTEGASEWEYEGVVPIKLDGARAQVFYRAFIELPAITKAGWKTEFDTKVAHHQARRNQSRLLQMSERLLAGV